MTSSEREAAVAVLLTVDPEIPVPPRHYGGIERIVEGLIAELTSRGVRVTLAAHPESKTSAQLRPWPAGNSRGARSLWRNRRHVQELLEREGPFDVLHSFGRLAYAVLQLRRTRIPMVQSYQRHITPSSLRLGRLLGGRSILFTACGSPCWPGGRAPGDRDRVVPNFAPVERFRWSAEVPVDAPLVFLGRLERIKGPDIAIDVARRTGRRIVLAGTHSESGEKAEFFRADVRPKCDGTSAEYVGPVDDDAKNNLLASAAALLMPIRWEEPFGIVMAEALACGTPVIGLRRGAVPEVVRDGVTGFVCEDADEMVGAVGRLDQIRRSACRAEAEARFSPGVVVDAYLRAYADVASREARPRFLSAVRGLAGEVKGGADG